MNPFVFPSVGIQSFIVLLEIIAFQLFIQTVPMRSLSFKKLISYFSVYVAGVMFFHFQYYQFLLHCLTLIGCSVFFLMTSRTVKLNTALFLSAVMCLLYEVSKTVAYDVVYDWLFLSFFAQLQNIGGLFQASFYGILLLLSVLIIRPLLHQQQRYPLQNHQLFLILFPIIPYAYVRQMRFWYDALVPVLTRDITLLTCLFGVCCLLMVLFIEQQVCTAVRKQEMLKMENLLIQQSQQILIKKEAMEALQHQVHDIKHLITAMKAMRSNDEVIHFAQELEDSIKPMELLQKTGNEVLDVLLCEKLQQCEQEQIRLVPYVDGQWLCFMNPIDLCILFGNAVDNAIDAVRPLTKPEERQIDIKVARIKKMVALRFHNHYQGIIHDQLRTSKADAENHGYGLANIRRIVENHHGSMQVDTANQKFILTILLPLPTSFLNEIEASVQ